MSADETEIAKIWIQIAQLIGTVVVAALAVAIASRQAETARYKLKYDLYKSRFEIYEAATELVSGIANSLPFSKTEELFQTFQKLNRHANFLLKPELRTYLMEFQISAAQFNQAFRPVSEFIAREGREKMDDPSISGQAGHVQHLREGWYKLFDELIENFRDPLDFRQLK